jgi:hypothetical protein
MAIDGRKFRVGTGERLGQGSVQENRGDWQKHFRIINFCIGGFGPGDNKKLSDKWALCEKVGVKFLVGVTFNLFGSLYYR